MKLLITGANGMLAHDLIQYLQSYGWPYEACTKTKLDITQPEAIQAKLASFQPDGVVNCAAYTQVDLAEKETEAAQQINGIGPKHLAEQCAKAQIKLVHISTDFVFDGQSADPYVESAPTNPLGAYGQTKLAGEQAILAKLENHLIIRTSWLYGVQGKNFVKTMVRLAKERPELRVVHDQIGSPTWTADLAYAIVALLETNATGVVHFSNRGQCSWCQFAQEAIYHAYQQGLTSKVPPVHPITTAEYPTPAKRPAFSVLDTSRYKQWTQQTPPRWQESLAHMIHQLAQASE